MCLPAPIRTALSCIVASLVVSALTPARAESQVPGPPTSLTATADGESIDLSWDPPSDIGGSAIVGYRIEVSFDGVDWFGLEDNTGSTATTFRDNVGLGSTRYYRVSAVNEDGTGPSSNAAHAITEGGGNHPPGPPRNLTAMAAGQTAIDLSWDPPENTGGSAIADYLIEVSSDGGQEWSVLTYTVAGVTTYRHSGLSAATTRHYRVSATNEEELVGPPSDVASATTETDAGGQRPGPPQFLNARANGESAIDLTWRAPADAGSSPITGYRIEVSTDGGTIWADLRGNTGSTAMNFTHGGLEPGSTRHYRVSAINAAGTSLPSNVAAATTSEGGTGEDPGTPTVLTATAEGQSAIRLSWTAPADTGGSAITGYRIEISSDGGTNWVDLLNNTGSTVTNFTDTGLTPGSTRHYRVSAINAAGTGNPSAVAGATTQGEGVPGPPTGVVAVAEGAGRINLSWTEPAATAATGYRIEMSSNGGVTWTDLVANTGSTGTTYAHTGLSSGTTLHYRVSAINAAGTGPPSIVTSATTGATVATAPTNVTARAIGTSRIDLFWMAPADDGGDAVTGYRIQVSSDSESAWSTLVDNTGSAATTYSHTGLSPASALRYRVQAINAGGVGPESGAAAATTDAAVADAPTELAAVARGSSQIDLSWKAPVVTGGVPVTGYQIEVHGDGKIPWTILVADTHSAATLFYHDDLDPGSTWRYRVSAVNSAGTGKASKAARATTDPVAPGPPTKLEAAANGSDRIDLTWTAPEYDGGGRIVGYRIEIFRESTSQWTVLADNTGSAVTEYAHTGLDPASARTYRVAALNAVGPGEASNTVGATTDPVAPDPPRQLSAAVNGTSRIDLAWIAPNYDGGARITGYRIEVSDNGGAAWAELVADTRSDATTFANAGLRPATARHYRVSAINRSGAGQPSNVVQATTDATVPYPPEQLVGSARDHARVDLGWDAPAFDGGARITGYRIEFSEDSGASWLPLAVNTRSTNTYHLHEGLRPATMRHYRVFALNEMGLSEPSNVASAITDAIAPDPPTRLVATAATPTRIELTWKAPQYDGGALVTAYRIEVSEDGAAWADLERSTGTKATTYAHAGLQPGSTRHYRVSAVNAAGTGLPSGVATATTDDPVERAGRVNEFVLPHFAAAMTGSTLSAIAARIEAVASRGPLPTRVGAAGLMSLSGAGGSLDPEGGPTMGRLLDGASFVVPFGGGAGAQEAGSGRLLGAWGAADYQGMGEPHAEDVKWEGNMLSLHAGTDMRIRSDLLVGVAGSRSAGSYEFTDLTGASEIEGAYEAAMTSVSPYAAWLPGGVGVALWAVGSLGWGEVAVNDQVAGKRTSGVRMLTGALGGRRGLLASASSSIGLRTEAWVTRVDVGGTKHMKPVTLEMQRVRLLVEWTQAYRYAAGHEMIFMLEGGLRYDIGDAVNGMGMELGGGFRYVSPSRTVTLEGRGRARLSGSSGYREWGVGGRVEITPQGGNRGLSLRLAPAWGEAASGVQELWERAVSDRPGGGGGPEGRLNAEMEYGLPALPAVPYGRVQLAPGGSRTFGTGMRYEMTRVLDLRLEGTHRKNHANNASHRLAISGRWHF